MAHDVGGMPTHDPVPREQHAFAPWEFRVDALMWLLTDASRTGGPRMTVDELRRGIEALPAGDYTRLGYYEKWLLSMVAILGERGLIDPAALERRAAQLSDHDARSHG